MKTYPRTSILSIQSEYDIRIILSSLYLMRFNSATPRQELTRIRYVILKKRIDILIDIYEKHLVDSKLYTPQQLKDIQSELHEKFIK